MGKPKLGPYAIFVNEQVIDICYPVIQEYITKIIILEFILETNE